MAYLSIKNLYQFVREYSVQYREEKEIFALSKLHGSSSSLTFENNQLIKFFCGGIKQELFEALFDKEYLLNIYNKFYSPNKIILFGECYGGRLQKMSHTYGEKLRYCGFEVKKNNVWLNVPQAEEITRDFGLDFVYYWRCPNEIEFLDYYRDHPSMQAKKNGILEDRPEEGIVCRAINERMATSQYRWIFKHKRKEFTEVKTPRTIDESKLTILTNTKEISEEWVTPIRLEHILGKISQNLDLTDTGQIVKMMIDDVKKESMGEIIWTKDVEKVIGRRAAHLFKEYLNKQSEEILYR